MQGNVIRSRRAHARMLLPPATRGEPGASGPSRAAQISHAVELVAALRGLGPEEALHDLRAAAARTGTTPAEVARTVILFHGTPDLSAEHEAH
jgi:hypothetical protein